MFYLKNAHKNESKNSSIMMRLLKISIVVLIFLLLFAVLNSVYYARILTNQQEERSMRKINNIVSAISNEYESIKLLLYQLTNDSQVKLLLYGTNTDNNINKRYQYLADMLNTIEVSLDNYHSIYIWLKNVNKIVSKEGTTSVDTMFNGRFRDNYESISNLANDYNVAHFLPETYIYEASAYNNVQGTLCNLFLYSTRDVTVVITVKCSKYNSIMKDILYQDQDDGLGIVLDESLRTIARTTNSLTYTADYKINSIEEYLTLLETENSQFSFLCTKSGQFYYILGQNKITFDVKGQKLNVYISIMILVCIMFMIIFFSLLNKEIYKPIRRIIEKLDTKIIENNKDEYSIVYYSINEMKNKISYLDRMLQEREKDFRAYTINKIIMGIGSGNNEISEVFETYDITSYIVLSAEFESDEDDNGTEYALMFCKELKERFNAHIISNINNQQIYLIPMDASKMEILLNFIHEIDNVFYVIGISKFHSLVCELRVAFEESREVYDATDVVYTKYGIVFTSGSYEKRDNKFFQISINDENCLIGAVVNGDIEEVEKVLQNLLEKNKNLSIMHQRDFHIYLINILLVVLQSKELAFSRKRDLIKLIDDLRKMIRVEKMNYLVIEEYKNITQLFCTERDDLINTIIDYIEKHYNQDIYLQLIADKVEMSYSYLSHYFKKCCGVNFVDYVNSVRVEKAKTLLTDTDYTVNEIAEMVGFASTNTFIRTLKKLYGITPGTYRKLYKQ